MKDDIHRLHDHFLISLTREDYIESRKMDIKPIPNTRSSNTEPPKPMTAFSGHTKPITISESKKTSTPNQPWKKFCLRTNKTNLKIQRRSKWLTLTHTQLFVTLSPNHPLFWIHLILNPTNFILLILVLHLRNHLKMWMNLISVTQPAPLPI